MVRLTDFDGYMMGIGLAFRDYGPALAAKILAKCLMKYKTQFGVYDTDPNNGRELNETFIWVLNPINKQWYPYAQIGENNKLVP